MESLIYLIQVYWVGCGNHLLHIFLVDSSHEDLKGSFLQCSVVIVRESSIASLYKIMVEGGVGVLRRADGHIGEVQICNGVGGDRGGDWVLLPLIVRFADQDSSSDESKADN